MRRRRLSLNFSPAYTLPRTRGLALSRCAESRAETNNASKLEIGLKHKQLRERGYNETARQWIEDRLAVCDISELLKVMLSSREKHVLKSVEYSDAPRVEAILKIELCAGRPLIWEQIIGRCIREADGLRQRAKIDIAIFSA